MHIDTNYVYVLYVYMFSGWWFQPRWNILVSCYFDSQYVGNKCLKIYSMKSHKTCFFQPPTSYMYIQDYTCTSPSGWPKTQPGTSILLDSADSVADAWIFRCPDDPPVFAVWLDEDIDRGIMHIQLCNIHIYIYQYSTYANRSLSRKIGYPLFLSTAWWSCFPAEHCRFRGISVYHILFQNITICREDVEKHMTSYDNIDMNVHMHIYTILTII